MLFLLIISSLYHSWRCLEMDLQIPKAESLARLELIARNGAGSRKEKTALTGGLPAFFQQQGIGFSIKS